MLVAAIEGSTGRANEPLKRNPLFSTRDGIASLLTRRPRPVLLRQGGESTCAWIWPEIYEPGLSRLEARFDGGRLASLRSDDSQVTLRYGGNEVPELALEWPDLPVVKRDDVDVAAVLGVMSRVAQKLGVKEPGEETGGR